MAIYHCSIQIMSRSTGRSAIACAAYRSASALYNEEIGEVSDFTNKHGVVYSEIMLPANAPAAYQDRATLWNAVQAVEKAGNAQLAREVEVGLPKELSRETQIKLVQEYVRENFVDRGMIADFSIHDKEDGNPHAHIMLTTRGLKANGEWAAKEKKDYARDENGEKIPLIDPETGLQKVRIRKGKGEEKLWQRVTVEANDWNKQANAEIWRASWATHCNQYLAPENHIDHRSYARQGIDLEPTVHEGPAARAMEARGEVSDRCQANREIRERNTLRKRLREEMQKIEKAVADLKERIRAAIDGQRAPAPAMAYDFGPVIAAQQRYWDLEKANRTTKTREPDQWITQAPAVQKAAMKRLQDAWEAQAKAAKDYSRAMPWAKKMAKQALEEAKAESRAAYDDLKIYGRYRTVNKFQEEITGDQIGIVYEEQMDEIMQQAKVIQAELQQNALYEIREAEKPRKPSLDEKEAQDKAMVEYQTLCRNLPASCRQEARQALRAALDEMRGKGYPPTRYAVLDEILGLKNTNSPGKKKSYSH